MTEPTPTPTAPTPTAPTAPAAPTLAPHHAAAPATYAPAGQPAVSGAPIGKIRSTGACVLLAIVTFGIYTAVWYYKVHSEMKRHSGQGLDGGVAVLLALFVGIVMPYLTASEVGRMYERRGQVKPVSGSTGLWYFPGIFLLIGPLVWFVKTNGALNSYWRSLGAV